MRDIVLAVGKQSPVPTRNGRPGLRWLLRQVLKIVEDLHTAISDPYRPELHYMRGPGPRWRAKHGRSPRRSTDIAPPLWSVRGLV